MSSEQPFAIVVGAGPSGLLLSLLLAKNNIPVTLVEKSKVLDKQPRATHYSGPAVRVLYRAGVLDAIDEQGFSPDKLSFRTLDNIVLATIDHTIASPSEDRIRCLPLDQVNDILLSNLKRQSNVSILWDHEIIELKDDGGIGVVTVNTPDGPKDLCARFVIACDGANSKIRRLLFGDWEFPGRTWDTQIVATNVRIFCPRQADHFPVLRRTVRSTTIFTNLGTMTPISSSILSIGIWLPESPKKECGVSATVFPLHRP